MAGQPRKIFLPINCAPLFSLFCSTNFISTFPIFPASALDVLTCVSHVDFKRERERLVGLAATRWGKIFGQEIITIVYLHLQFHCSSSSCLHDTRAHSEKFCVSPRKKKEKCWNLIIIMQEQQLIAPAHPYELGSLQHITTLSATNFWFI